MKERIKLVLLLFIAYGITTTVSPVVFVSNTPVFRPHLNEYIAYRFESAWSDTKTSLASIFGKDENTMIANYQKKIEDKRDKLINIPFKELSQGVYAKDEGNTHSLVEVNLDEIVFIEHTFVIKGKTITIRIPKDQEPPPQQALESIYGN